MRSEDSEQYKKAAPCRVKWEPLLLSEGSEGIDKLIPEIGR